MFSRVSEIYIILLVANTIFGNEEELLLNSFMEKIEKNLINSTLPSGKRLTNLIKASAVLEITLEDYHQSRRLYGQSSSNINFEKNEEDEPEKIKNSQFFEEYDEDGGNNDYNYSPGQKRVSLSKLNPKEITKNPLKNLESVTKEIQSKSSQDNNTKIKSLIFNYIKEKELDM